MKTQLGAALKEYFFVSLPGDNKLCVVQYLKLGSCNMVSIYIALTVFVLNEALWNSDIPTVSTLGKGPSKVDTEMFKAHSARRASTSAALKNGLHFKEILDIVDRSCFKFYCWVITKLCKSIKEVSCTLKYIGNLQAPWTTRGHLMLSIGIQLWRCKMGLWSLPVLHEVNLTK